MTRLRQGTHRQEPVVAARQKRLRILDEDELEALYGQPRFTPEERAHYFSFSSAEHEKLQEFRSIKSQAAFMLQLGYFKARHLFFLFGLQEVIAYLQYILMPYCPDRPLP